MIVAAGIGAGVVATASADEDTAGAKKSGGGQGEECYRLTSETAEGPYYVDADKFRKGITEDKEGIPLTLWVNVIDSETCKPVAHAAVDIWHCDALGVYDRSGVTGGLMELAYRKRHMARGVVGSITMGVDPDETHDGTDL